MIRPVALAIITLVTSLTLVGVACQTYDFEPVTPLTLAQTTQTKKIEAKRFKPNAMLLVDKSGSMSGPIDPNGPNCTPGCGPSQPCPAGCRTRISELRAAMSTFLTRSGTVARFGLAFFPAGGGCEPTASVSEALPTPTPDDTGTDVALSMKAMAINNKISLEPPNGGTPTGKSLAFVGTVAGLLDTNDFRDDFVILLTDGLPNCNDSNQNQVCTCSPNFCGACGSGVCQAQKDACKCTTSSCATNLCQLGCLDKDGSTQQIAALNGKGIRTIVVGFGADTAGGDAAEVLNSMAAAGGFPRTCTADADCGGAAGSCNVGAKTCVNQFYQATTADQLADALAKISADIVSGNLCEFKLTSQPSDPRLLSVRVDDQDVPSGPNSWTYTGGAVLFADGSSYCTAIRASSSQHPVVVDIRVVQQL